MKRKAEPTREEIIGFLQRAADQLELEKSGTVLHWLGERLRSYLNGDALTLQQAIGLPPGRPSTNRRRNIDIATEMLKFKKTAAAKHRGAIKKMRKIVGESQGLRGLNVEKTVASIEDQYHAEAVYSLNTEKIFSRRNKIFKLKTKG